MPSFQPSSRRDFMITGAMVSLSLPTIASAIGHRLDIGALKQVEAGELQVGYYEVGRANDPAVVLLHGFPYDVHSYVDVAPILASRGYRVIVPHLRGHGSTRFRSSTTSRSGEQAAIGKDLIDLLDGLKIDRAIFAGYDWGGRAACVGAALWPHRCNGLVSVNGYLIQDIAKSATPAPAKVERGFWYQFYFQTERGRAGLEAHRNDIANIMWRDNSPRWQFSPDEFARSARSFDNPDYVDVVIHSYRHRLGSAPGHPQFEAIESELAKLPSIRVPTITLDGDSDGVIAATNAEQQSRYFTGRRTHRIVSGIGHNLPQEAPATFADAIMEVSSYSRT